MDSSRICSNSDNADENLATYGIIIASFFPGIAYTMILYITGLTGVNREMIEAGRIDGASGFTMLWHVVLPQLRVSLSTTY